MEQGSQAPTELLNSSVLNSIQTEYPSLIRCCSDLDMPQF
jgi:hypothetical protein